MLANLRSSDRERCKALQRAALFCVRIMQALDVMLHIHRHVRYSQVFQLQDSPVSLRSQRCLTSSGIRRLVEVLDMPCNAYLNYFIVVKSSRPNRRDTRINRL